MCNARRDEHGRDHLVLADMGCRNTVFNAQAQSGAHHMRTWSLSGYGWLRVELVDEPADAVGPLLDGYRAVLGGQTTSRELWEFLETVPDKNGRCHG